MTNDQPTSEGEAAEWDEAGQNRTRRAPQTALPQATVMIVAGLDPSGGAGLLADALVVAHHGFHAAGVATALTEQDSTQCSWMHPVDPSVISSQLARLVDDLDVRAVKLGMLASPQLAEAVATALGRLAERQVPIVVDPVLRATRGVPLFEGDAREALGRLFRMATVVTPNLEELGALTGRAVDDLTSMHAAAQALRAFGVRAVLAKGGHLTGDPVDLLVDEDGELRLRGQRVPGPPPHGTGCALSTDLACRLALGTPLREAAAAATAQVRERIAAARTVGHGRPFLG